MSKNNRLSIKDSYQKNISDSILKVLSNYYSFDINIEFIRIKNPDKDVSEPQGLYFYLFIKHSSISYEKAVKKLCLLITREALYQRVQYVEKVLKDKSHINFHFYKQFKSIEEELLKLIK